MDRHRLDDQAPYAYRTRDGGRSWTRIDRGLALGGGPDSVNVVREDPVRAGLLYAGTERGAFVSLDDGDHWRPLQAGLPRTSVRDIEVHGDDLVIATHGRGFYIMDDVAPLRALAADPRPATRLFAPATAVRVRNPGFTGTPKPADEPKAPNPPDGAYLDYALAAAPAGAVTLSVFDAQGGLVRSVSSADPASPPDLAKIDAAPEWIVTPEPLLATPGAHRFVWDLHYAAPDGAKGGRRRQAAGVWAPPGRYTVALTVDGATYRQPLTITPDPRVKLAPDAYARQFALARQVEVDAARAHAALTDAGKLRTLLAAAQAGADASRRARLEALSTRLQAVADLPADDPRNSVPAPAQALDGLNNLAATLDKLMVAVDGADADPSPDARAGYAKARAALDPTLARWAALKGEIDATLGAAGAGGSPMSLAAALALALAAAPMSVPPAPPSAAADDAPRWRLLGPFRAGWATMVEGVPSQPDTVYFGAAGGGLWRTRNAGRTWAPLFDHGPASSIGALAVAPSDSQTLYIGTGQPEPRYDVAAGLGVYKSTDGGATWASAGLQSTRYIGKILVDAHDANTVLVGAQGHVFGPSPDRGVYRTTDGGKTWAQTLKLGAWTGVVDLARDPAEPGTVFAAAWEARQYPWQSYFTPVSGAGSGVYKSTDGGATWTRLEGGGWPAGALGRISLATARTSQGLRVYAVVDSPKAGGLYRSDDGGAHWLRVNPEDAVSSYYASRVTVAPDDPDTVYLVGQSIRRCREGGRTCEIVRGSPGGDDYHFVWINPLHPDHMAAGSDQGAIVSVDGGRTWSDWYNQPTGQFYHLAADDRFPYRIYSGQQDSGTVGILSRSDYGAITFRDWTPVGGDERDYDVPDPADPDIVYGSGLGGRVSKWDARTGQVQNVAPWPVSSYGQRPTGVRYRYNWVTPLAASRTGPPAIYLGSQLVFRSADQGRTWATISGDLTGKRDGAQRCDGEVAVADARACGYGTIVALQPSPRHADELWVGTDDGLVQLTRDGGAHWADVTPPQVADWQKVQTLDASALQDGVAYAAVDGQRLDDFQPHLLATRDYGAHWRDITADLPRDHIVSVVRADPVQPGLLYAGTDAGAFASFDDGGHWRPLQANLPTAWVRDLLVHGDDLVAATQGRAIWVFDGLASLRQRAASPAPRTRLFAPSPTVRVHADENKDTPPPPRNGAGREPARRGGDRLRDRRTRARPGDAADRRRAGCARAPLVQRRRAEGAEGRGLFRQVLAATCAATGGRPRRAPLRLGPALSAAADDQVGIHHRGGVEPRRARGAGGGRWRFPATTPSR